MEIIKEGPDEYMKLRIGNMLIDYQYIVLFLSILSSFILLIIGLVFGLYKTYETLTMLIIVIFFVGVLPPLFYKVYVQNINNKILNKYPLFLRDLAEALSSGMDLVQALKHVSSIDYGPLSKFIRKLYAWLSWGVNFIDAFEKFNRYFKDNPTIVRSNYIILEAYKEGGNISKVLETVANDLESIQELNKLQKSYMSQQVFVLYVIFFIFVGLIIILKFVLQPMILQQLSITQAQNFGFSIGTLDFEEFKRISAAAIIIEAIVIAFVIGVAENGKVSSGLKHLAITLTTAIIVSLVFILPYSVKISLFIFPKNAFTFQNVKIQGTVAIDAKPAEGSVLLKIVGPSSKIINLTLKNGKFEYTFNPYLRGDYKVIVNYKYGAKVYSASDTFKVT